MKYIRLFEQKESKFKIGDYVRFTTDCLGDEYELDEEEQKEVSIVSRIDYAKNDDNNLIVLDRMGDKVGKLDNGGGKWYVIEDEIEKLDDFEVAAYKYNL